jgi:hypothetical protein
MTTLERTPAMKGELVFVPLFGEESVEDWRTVPHIKVWGLTADFGDALGGNLVLLHWDGPENTDIANNLEVMGRVSVFGAEWQHAEREPTNVPDIVAQRLAQLALAPETLPVRED